MQIGIIGINHKSADVALREQFAKTCQRRFGSGYSAHPHVTYVLLSTCNRTELYFCSDDLAATHTYILGVLRSDITEEFEHRVYSYFGKDCFFHLACVTSGMDSAIIGETEIQGQVKKAYETAAEYYFLPKELHFLFQKCLNIGKKVRSTLSSTPPPFFEEAIVSAATYLFGNLKQKKVLFVGISEINTKVFLRLKRCDLQEIYFCNRSQERREQLTKYDTVGWLPWESLHEWLSFDIIVFGTKSPDYLVTRHTLKLPLTQPKLVVDLSVPRNVDPELGKVVTLLNVDQLYRMIDKNQKLKAVEFARLEAQDIAHSVARQVAIFQAKNSYRPNPSLSAIEVS